MIKTFSTQTGFRIVAALPLCLLVAAGCSKSDQNATGDTSTPGNAPPKEAGGRMPGGMGRPGGGPGGPGGRNAPVAANASGEEIYSQKCGCHGPSGKGGNAPMIAGGGGKSDDALYGIVHDGKGKMPSFAAQLSEDQIKKVVASVKSFK